MPRQGQHDQFENRYLARLNALLANGGIPVTYPRDHAGIDTGLHLFVEGPGNDYQSTHTRVWFQAKGKRAATLSAEQFDAAADVSVSVKVEHLKYWFAAPEPVYLVVFVEAKQLFIAEDARAIVYRMWPSGDFYDAVGGQASVTVHLDKEAVLGESRIKSMLSHKSMRIDGPAFQGRPLGHRFDPLRSELSIDSPELWEEIITKLLAAYRFREVERSMVTPRITVLKGRFYDTMMWQSSAFAEFGFGPDIDYRDDPPVEFLHGEVTLVLDASPDRSRLSMEERTALQRSLSLSEAPVVLFFFGRELSGTARTWRRYFSEVGHGNTYVHRHLIGTESVTSMVLVATLVYLELAPRLSFRIVNYR
jgi:hypothetical protein